MKSVLESRSLASWSLALAGALAVLSAKADTWYLKQSMGTSTKTATYLEAMSDASYWTSAEGGTNGVEMVTTDTYVVSKGYNLSCNSAAPFQGGSLVIGDLASPNYSTRLYCNGHVGVPNGVLTFACGYAQHGSASSSGYIINPNTYVTAPVDAPFGVTCNGSNYKNFTLAKLIGEPGTGIIINGRYTGNGSYSRATQTNLVYTLSDISQYHGDITVMSGRSHLSRDTGNIRVTIAMSDAFGGSLEMEDGVDFQASGAKELAVSNLTFHAGSSYRVSYSADTKTASVIRVSHKFSIPEEEGTVYIRFSTNPAVSVEEKTYPLIIVPESEDLDVTRFSVNETLAPEYLPRLFVVHDEAAHTKTLVATFCAVIKLVKGDDTDYYTGLDDDKQPLPSALAEGSEDSWQDKQLPHGEFTIYDFGQKSGYGSCIRTKYRDAEPYVFPGKLLRTIGGAQAHLILNGSLSFGADIVTTGNTPLQLKVLNGCDPTLTGTLALTSGGCTYYAYAGSVLTIASRLSGTGNLSTSGGRSDTGSPTATMVLAGDNSEWKGTLSVNMNWSSGTPSYGKHQSVRISDAKNLGGPLDEFNYKALSLNKFSEVLITNSLALSKDTNRGIYVTNAAIFNVSADCTFDCGWPVTFAGTLYKTGAGTVGLSGVKFRDAAGALTDEIPENAEHRLLVVTNGCVKALSHDCLDGITVDLRKPTSTISTSLAVAFNPEDANLKRYGFYNVKTTTPFAEGHAINFRILNVDTVALAAARLTDEGYKQGLITVKTTAAKNVEDNLVVEKVKGLRLIREDDAETGFTTFSLYGKKAGILLLVR